MSADTSSPASSSSSTSAIEVVVPENFSESHSWTTKLKECFCGDLDVLPDENPAYFDAFPDINAFRVAMRDQANPKTHGARVYLTHRFIVHKLRALTATQFPTREAFSEAQSRASQSVADLMGDISFLVDSDNPGIFASVYVENFVKSFSHVLPIVVRRVVSILELDRLVAEDGDIDNVLKYSPPPPPPPPPSEQQKEAEQKACAGCPRAKSSAELLLAMKQNAKSVGQFSKALRDPELAFKQISLSAQIKKQQPPQAAAVASKAVDTNTAVKPKEEGTGEKQEQKVLATKRKRRW